MNEGDYHYAIHNVFYDNANVQCDAQASGWSAWEEHPIPGYTPTADDMTNPNPLLGPTWQVGSFFHVVVEYNVAYNNAVTQCAYDTDGNGIIFDTNAGFYGNPTNYTAPMLAAFNVTTTMAASACVFLDRQISQWPTIAATTTTSIRPTVERSAPVLMTTMGGPIRSSIISRRVSRLPLPTATAGRSQHGMMLI